MQCSWKAVALLALASIAIQYTAIRTFSPATPSALGPRGASGGPGRACDELPSTPSSSSPSHNTSRRTHILILATTRSGSSFVGQLFNQNPEVFYLFEPLYHVQTALLPRLGQSRRPAERRVMLGASRELLRSLFQCRLAGLEGYIRPRPANHSTDRLFRRGASRALCSPPVCEGPQGPEEERAVALGDEGECVRRCGPLNVSRAAEACGGARHLAIKTVRVPQVSDLRPLLEDPRLNLKVIQLVRDPRGILASRMETFRDTYRLWRLWRATGRRPYNLDLGQVDTVCQDLLGSVSTGLAAPAWLRGRYILLRYEDLARSPLQKTRELYGFLGLPLDAAVEAWILNNTRGGSGGAGPLARQRYGTVRDSAARAESWRQALPYDMAAHTQAACRPLLQLLGYRSLAHPGLLRNLSFSLVERRAFPPPL